MKIPENLQQFKATYYYKTELSDLCKKLGLPTSGTKAELNSYLTDYFSGIAPEQIRVKRKTEAKGTLTCEQITLDTKVVGSGLKFNNETRKFLTNYYGLAKFSFKKEMAIVKRRAELEHDTALTLRQLLKQAEVLSRTQINQVAEEQTYQWNNFVRDFFQDPATQKFHDRLQVAALLWQHVRVSKEEKIYNSQLLDKYANEIAQYLK